MVKDILTYTLVLVLLITLLPLYVPFVTYDFLHLSKETIVIIGFIDNHITTMHPINISGFLEM